MPQPSEPVNTDPQLTRIKTMELRLTHAQVAIANLQSAWKQYKETLDDIEALNHYLGSAQWHADREDEYRGVLPPDLHRGVLSEDGIWNLLESQKEILCQIQKEFPLQ